MKTFVIAVTLLLAACNQEQAASAYQQASKTFNESQRDSVIANWQRRVADTPQCASFKQRFKAAGARHDSAASALFQADMMKVWEATTAAGCAYSP